MAHYASRSLWSLMLTGEAKVEANTAGSASQHYLYKQFQNPHIQISEKLQSVAIKVTTKVIPGYTFTFCLTKPVDKEVKTRRGRPC